MVNLVLSRQFVNYLVGLCMGAFPLGFEGIRQPFNFGIIDGGIDFGAMGLGIDMSKIIFEVFLTDRTVAIFLAGPGEDLE